MVILGFMLNYMLRVNLTIAVVSMVLPENHTSDGNEFTASAKCVDSGTATEVDSPSRPVTANTSTPSAPLRNVRPPRNRNHADVDSHEDYIAGNDD